MLFERNSQLGSDVGNYVYLILKLNIRHLYDKKTFNLS